MTYDQRHLLIRYSSRTRIVSLPLVKFATDFPISRIPDNQLCSASESVTRYAVMHSLRKIGRFLKFPRHSEQIPSCILPALPLLSCSIISSPFRPRKCSIFFSLSFESVETDLGSVFFASLNLVTEPLLRRFLVWESTYKIRQYAPILTFSKQPIPELMR